jgi:hypothetical protein
MFAAREVSKLMPVGTIVLVYDKVSFVSAKDWAMNPQRKQAALSVDRGQCVRLRIRDGRDSNQTTRRS